MKCLIKSVASQQLLHGLSLILVLMGLSACSGDGGGSSSSSAPAPSVALTSTNAEEVTGAAFEQFVGDTSVGSTAPFSAAGTTSQTGQTTTLVGLAKKTASLLISQTSSKFSATAATTDPCAISGSTTTNYAADGTSATITYTDCEDDAGVVINGSMSVSNISTSGSVFSFTTSFDLTFSVSGQPDSVFSGGYNFALDTATFETTIAGTSFSGTDGTETFGLFNFTFTFVETAGTGTSASADYTLSLSSPSINGAVTVKTLTKFETYDTATYPHTGQMEITGANNSQILVTVLGDETAVGDQVQIDIDADGDGVFETTIKTTWATLGT